MQEQEKKPSGFYRFGFYITKINRNVEPHNLDVSDEEYYIGNESLFFHEYVHYLQNIGSIYGLYTSYVTVIHKYATLKSWISENDTINIPLSFSTIDPEKKIYQEWYEKTVKNPDTSVQQSEIKDICVRLDASNICNVTFLVEGAKKVNFDFNTMHIIEGMARLVEELTINPDKKANPTVPYHTAVILANKIAPEFAKNKINILALCEYTLNFELDSGRQYFDLLEQIDADKFTPLNIKNIFDYCDKFYSDKNFNNQFVQRAKGVSNYLNLILKNFSEDAEKALGSVYSSLISLRNVKPYFISLWVESYIEKNTKLQEYIENKSNDTTFSQDEIKRKFIENQINQLIKSYSLPTYINTSVHGVPHENEGLYSDNDDISGHEALFAFWDIFSYLENGGINPIYIYKDIVKTCSLLPFCKRNKDGDITNKNCGTPWERVKEENHTCPFTIAWEVLGLKNKKIIYSNEPK